MLPLYFGESQRALFGFFHPARRSSPAPTAVVLCHPLGYEYVGAYRTMRVVATRLAEAGLPAFRFDYFGTGDSAGEGSEATIEQWLSDIRTAIDETQAMAEVRRVRLLGLRFGANLAAVVASKNADIERVVLWEPVSSGAEQLHEQLHTHRSWQQLQLEFRHAYRDESSPREALGFPLAEPLVSQLRSFNLTDLPSASIERVLLLHHDAARGAAAANRLRRIGRQVDVRVVNAPNVWEDVRDLERSLVPTAAIEIAMECLTS